jgi:preprotein translocase subunit SecE
LGVQIPPGLPYIGHRERKKTNCEQIRIQEKMINKVKGFLDEVKVEIKKVVFPSKDELIGSTWVVIITVLVISIFLGIVDLGLSRLVAVALR